LYARVIFFPLPVDDFVELLGDVKAVHHRLRRRQQRPTGIVVRLRHVRPVHLDPAPLRFAQLFQAFPGRTLIASFGDRQHFGLGRVTQVGQDRAEELVPLLEAQLVDAHIGDQPPRIAGSSVIKCAVLGFWGFPFGWAAVG